ncbi:uncharacterized protein LAESUDRAFT_41560 [Laetiporus sulphureus 93-53]|uniref:C2H2-type domain-containing protein n=1 Tax=Laetiporus sulphureus 93-53 TaxID=1314785 RepID=A0A165F7M6_9APHY|nr:uncharacterized protein LAESUDRAFT_41560 [Laetiporus sulphureus 93-53]KZT08548.1 hypothetical protein LAESUDRAFT_41560 [Laetiporus sulphureus 93-53]
MPLDDADPRSLVPLHTLQHALYRQLYPFDIANDGDHAFQFMTQPMPSPRPADPSLSPPPLSNTGSSKASTTSEPHTPLQSAPAQTDENSPRHECQWIDCDRVFADPEGLYNHLCNDHIGRKSTGNLCLTCKWKECGTTCAKRDHITSHLRVHTPLKPHVCVICKKPFKRPQDLKKHEKIHTEEHHAQHKHSKAITVADPSYNSRVRGDHLSSAEALPSHDKKAFSQQLPSVAGMDKVQPPVARAKSNSLSVSDRSSGAGYGLLATPSPEIHQAAIRYPNAETGSSRAQLYHMQNQLPTWEVLTVDGTPSRTTGSGSKRSHDEYSVDDFFTDMKKRRVNPSYDPNMAARLNTLAYQHSLGSTQSMGPAPVGNSMFNPRSVSFDIRSPEELAAVNEFLIALGRDVAGSGGVPRQQQPHPQQHHHPNMSSTQHMPSPNEASSSTFFDAASLNQLGLAGMPGIPTAPGPGSGAGYHGDAGYLSVDFSSHHLPPVYPSRSSHQSVQAAHFGGYPSPQDMMSSNGSMFASMPYSGSRTRAQRVSSVSSDLDERYHSNYAGSSMQQSYAYSQGQYMSPPHDGMPYAMPSPLSTNSTRSTPSNATPPRLSDSAPMAFVPEGTTAFDAVRPTRAPPPLQLAPLEYGTKNMRSISLLKTAPGSAEAIAASSRSRPEPMEPKLGTGIVRRGPPAKLTAEAVSSMMTNLSRPPLRSSSSQNDALYPLLTFGDEQFKLAPLRNTYRSPSPPVSESTSSPMSRGSTISPPPSKTQAHPSRHESSTPTSSSSPSTRSSLSPEPGPTVLPGIRSIATDSPRVTPRRRETEELTQAVGRIELDSRAARDVTPAQRAAHAHLVRDLLVSINVEYRKRFGTPPPPQDSAPRIQPQEELRDVEMVGA